MSGQESGKTYGQGWTRVDKGAGKSWARAVEWTRGRKRTYYDEGSGSQSLVEAFPTHPSLPPPA